MRGLVELVRHVRILLGHVGVALLHARSGLQQRRSCDGLHVADGQRRVAVACEDDLALFGDLKTLRRAYEEWPLFSTFIDNIEMSLAKTDERIAKMYLALGDREDLNKKVLDEMELTREWVLKIVGDEWPLQHRHVLGQAIRIRSPYVDALSVTQVLALGSLRKQVDKEELTHGQQENYTYLILCTVSGVAAGLQNTG